jgi:hypothetical protein
MRAKYVCASRRDLLGEVQPLIPAVHRRTTMARHTQANAQQELQELHKGMQERTYKMCSLVMDRSEAINRVIRAWSSEPHLAIGSTEFNAMMDELVRVHLEVRFMLAHDYESGEQKAELEYVIRRKEQRDAARKRPAPPVSV